MQYQTSPKYNPIGTDGCYFVSLGVWAEDILGYILPDAVVMRTYAACVSKGYMTYNCYIKNPEAVTNEFFRQVGSSKAVEYIGWWNKDTGYKFWGGNTKEDIDFEVIRVKTPWGKHFKTVGFNPDPNIASSKIDGYRYFKELR